MVLLKFPSLDGDDITYVHVYVGCVHEHTYMYTFAGFFPYPVCTLFLLWELQLFP